MAAVSVDLATILLQNLAGGFLIAKFIEAKRFPLAAALLTLCGFLGYGLTGYVWSGIPVLRVVLIYGGQLLVILWQRRVPLSRCLLYYCLSMACMVLVEVPFDLILLHYYPGFTGVSDLKPAFLLVWRMSFLPLVILSFLVPYVLLRRRFQMQGSETAGRFVPFLLIQTLLLLIPMVVVQEAMEDFEHISPVALVYILANVLLDVLLVQTFNHIGRIHALEQRQRQAQNMVKMQMDYYRQLQDNVRGLRQVRHDMKNQLTTLSILLENGDYDTARQQISAVERELGQGPRSTGNVMIDAVLESKEPQCREAGIRLGAEGRLPQDLGPGEVRLCSLVAAVLDHAIRQAAESQDIEAPEIGVAFVMSPVYRFSCRYPGTGEQRQEDHCRCIAQAAGFHGPVQVTEAEGQCLAILELPELEEAPASAV